MPPKVEDHPTIETTVITTKGNHHGDMIESEEPLFTRTDQQFATTAENWDIFSHFALTNTEGISYEPSSDRDRKIKFSLRNNVVFWKNELNSSSFVLNIVEKGYILPFIREPPSFYAENNKSSLRNAKFVEKAILDLLNNDFVVELPQRAYCSNPLTVSEKGKLRLVLDLRHVNQYLKVKSFCYEDLKTLAELIERDDFFVRFDLKSGYHHVDIHPAHHKYLGFEWIFSNNCRRYFQFTVLVFGLSTACQVFTKIMRPLNRRWREKGIKSVVYIDDGIGAKNSYEQAKAAAEQIRGDLEKAGFCINEEKSDFEPKQKGVWLGIQIDTSLLQFSLPAEKVKNLKSRLHNVMKKPTCTPKELSQVAGTLSSMHLAIGPLVRLFTRHIYHEIEMRSSWYEQIRISPKAIAELTFWENNIEYVNGFTFKHAPTTSKIVFTDAAGTGWGGFTLFRLEELICSGKFNAFEQQQSSTYRELLAVKLVLQSYGQILANQSIQVNVDNFSASRILSVGSRKTNLQNLAIDIFYHCMKYNVKLIPCWIPRDENYIADFYSKLTDTDDWTIDEGCFDHINARFGPFTVDRFSSDTNNKVPVFNSRFFVPGTSGVNAFTMDWRRHNNWLCPPVSMITAAIRHLKLCRARGTLLVPAWPSSYFWPVIYPNGTSMADFVKDFLVVDPFYISKISKLLSNMSRSKD